MGCVKEAEELSWYFSAIRKGSGSLSPWCLGVEAYTVMIKVYGKKELDMGVLYEMSDLERRK